MYYYDKENLRVFKKVTSKWEVEEVAQFKTLDELESYMRWANGDQEPNSKKQKQLVASA